MRLTDLVVKEPLHEFQQLGVAIGANNINFSPSAGEWWEVHSLAVGTPTVGGITSIQIFDGTALIAHLAAATSSAVTTLPGSGSWVLTDADTLQCRANSGSAVGTMRAVLVGYRYRF